MKFDFSLIQIKSFYPSSWLSKNIIRLIKFTKTQLKAYNEKRNCLKHPIWLLSEQLKGNLQFLLIIRSIFHLLFEAIKIVQFWM